MAHRSGFNISTWIYRVIATVVVPIVIPLTLAFLITALGFYVFSKTDPGSTGVANDYAVLKDTLAIVLSATGLVVVIFGAGAFFVLRDQINRAVETETSARARAATATALSVVGNRFWDQYEHTKDDFFLEQAISLAGMAYRDYALGLDDSKRDFEEVLCGIRNNWGYFLAEKARLSKASKAEMSIAISSKRYLEDRISKYPEHAEDWEDTVRFIREQCPVE